MRPGLKRLLALALAALAAALLAARPVAAAQPFQTSVPSAILIDADSQTVLFEKNADAPEVPASTTKVMTAELVFRALAQGKLKLDDTFDVSEHAWRTGGALARGSTMFAALNSKIRVEDLIRGLVIVSGNDAAIVLAEGLAGSEGAFATRMTERARELGFAHLTFTNPWGQDDPDQRVTSREMASLAAYLIRTYPQYYHYFGEKDFTWNKIKQPNRNPLLTMDVGADGLKTGNIDTSGYGIVASAVQNGQRLILVIYGAKSAKERESEAVRLFQWGFRSFESKMLFQPGEVVGYAQVYGGSSGSEPLVSDTPIRVLIPRDSDEKLKGQIVYTGPLMTPVSPGHEVAHLRVFRGPDEILEIPLRTSAAIGPGTLPRRAMDASLEFAEQLFRKYVLKK
ncbi:D-alanyl-D-alanine carboxypeptidase [Methylovirgula ligni]|uniref:serine-type D-Ala-D-Ala carboxypeptidase n=1 Tax=Methylovirgula ligni TaxID=569860 RepID=A0A3D9YKY8_9HYPH|nr:D-alanyl-D-alanine carboxypeptidase family protein [Methylovirgula ligni]QAY96739.1 D-alanyl-D-alanine carboxypeptidase [Methylovirgula ligni]REF83215.1 D-alanyl-D-alanine carboxypeptidase (penicillin-binding protein 5/6) [Methylovirgula ligni]